MPEGEANAVLLCALVIGIPVGTLIGAVCLRPAVALYNKLAAGVSSPWSVPKPAFGKALWINFDICVAQLVVGSLLILLGIDAGATAPGAQGRVVNDHLISVLVSFLITVGILSAKLPTTFGRAILVTLCDLLVALLVIGVLVVIAVVVFAIALSGG